MKTLISSIVGGVCVMVVLGQSIEINNRAYTGVLSQLEVANGQKMMRLKNIPEGNANDEAIQWNFPTTMVMGNALYHVTRSGTTGNFKIFRSVGGFEEPLAYGEITRMGNSMYSRVCGFGRMATSNLGVLSMALRTEARVLDSSTNTIYLASVHQQADVEEVLIHRNLFMRISGATNKFDFAISLLNAGLPESERLPLPPLMK